MKFLLFILLSFSLRASDFFDVAPFNVDFETTDVMTKIEKAINTPENVLVRYIPVGGTIKNKVVSKTSVNFVMTKKILGISKSFYVNFVVDIKEENVCGADDLGIRYIVDLAGSDSILYDNIDKLDFIICLKKINSNKVTAFVKGKIFKGNNYSVTVGSIAKNTIEDQVVPFINAIKSEVISALVW